MLLARLCDAALVSEMAQGEGEGAGAKDRIEPTYDYMFYICLKQRNSAKGEHKFRMKRKTSWRGFDRVLLSGQQPTFTRAYTRRLSFPYCLQRFPWNNLESDVIQKCFEKSPDQASYGGAQLLDFYLSSGAILLRSRIS